MYWSNTTIVVLDDEIFSALSAVPHSISVGNLFPSTLLGVITNKQLISA